VNTTRWLETLGVRVDGAAAVTGAELTLRHGSWLGGFVLLGLVLAAAAWWSHWHGARDLATGRQRATLVALRVALIALLLLLLLRPVLAFTLETAIRRTLVLLIDTSASMKIEDARVLEADRQRAAIAAGTLDPRRGLEQAAPAEIKPVARWEIVRQIFASDVLKLEERLRRECDLHLFAFGKAINDADNPKLSEWLEKTSADAPATALGDALAEVLQRKRGHALAGLVLITDGASNTGGAPLEAARQARAAGVPLLCYGVGVTTPRDLIVAGLLAPDTAFVKDELPVTVRVRGQGLRGESAKLTLRLGEEIVGEQNLAFTGDEEIAVPIAFTPARTGEYELRASFAARADEAVKDNNVFTQRLRVVDSRVKVLYLETAPRWEFRYVQSALLRDRRIDLKCVLLEGDPSLTQGEASPYLPSLPKAKEAWAAYDLIILGDVAAKDLGPEALAWIEDYVSKLGGSLLFLAGPRANPTTWKDTPLEKLLPVELTTVPAETGRPIAFELTAQGRTHPFLQLAADEAENTALWQKLPRLHWAARVGRAKAAAQVLLVDSDPAKATRGGKMPLIAMQGYGLGTVLYVGTDNTWRWRRGETEPRHAQLWGQFAQKLGLARLLGGSRRTQLRTDRQTYAVGDRVSIHARLYQPDFTPLRAAQMEGLVNITGSDGTQAVTLRAVPEQPGAFRGELTALAAGLHRFSLASDPETVLEFAVVEPRFEFGDTAMNEGLLRQMAELSGGAFFREENVNALPDAVRAKAETIKTVVDAELWSSPLYFLLLAVLASTEWALRKRWQLK
jgi:uncharacterized membrane protein